MYNILEEIIGQFESTATTVKLLPQMSQKDQMRMIVDHIVIRMLMLNMKMMMVMGLKMAGNL